MAHIPISWSKVNTFRLCPLQFKTQYLTKTYPQEDNNPHFIRGNNLHKQLEEYVLARLRGTKNVPALDKEALGAKPIVESILKNYETVVPESKICVDKDFKPVSWFDNSVAYFRCIIDLFAMSGSNGICVDYKTGKVRDYDMDGGQLHLTAGTLFALYPELEKLTMAYLYLDHKQTVKVEFTREDAPQLQGYIIQYFDEINAEEKFEPTVNDYCYFCKLTKDDCKYKTR